MHLNTFSNKHGIKTFSFRKPTRADDIVHTHESVGKNGETVKTHEYFPVSLPVVIFHRNDLSRQTPVIPIKYLHQFPSMRRFNKNRNVNSLLYRLLDFPEENTRQGQHQKRMERDQCAAYFRRLGILQPTLKQIQFYYQPEVQFVTY